MKKIKENYPLTVISLKYKDAFMIFNGDITKIHDLNLNEEMSYQLNEWLDENISPNSLKQIAQEHFTKDNYPILIERQATRNLMNPLDLRLINAIYDGFIIWYNDTSISDERKDMYIDSIISLATPFLIYPQCMRLEIIECWKEKFANYDFIIERLKDIK